MSHLQEKGRDLKEIFITQQPLEVNRKEKNRKKFVVERLPNFSRNLNFKTLTRYDSSEFVCDLMLARQFFVQFHNNNLRLIDKVEHGK